MGLNVFRFNYKTIHKIGSSLDEKYLFSRHLTRVLKLSFIPFYIFYSDFVCMKLYH